jgi:hypothetical protein
MFLIESLFLQLRIFDGCKSKKRDRVKIGDRKTAVTKDDLPSSSALLDSPSGGTLAPTARALYQETYQFPLLIPLSKSQTYLGQIVLRDPEREQTPRKSLGRIKHPDHLLIRSTGESQSTEEINTSHIVPMYLRSAQFSPYGRLTGGLLDGGLTRSVDPGRLVRTD